MLSLGPSPTIAIADWKLEIGGLVENPQHWNWEAFSKLPAIDVVKDIHCVTKWSKFETLGKDRMIPIKLGPGDGRLFSVQ